jgi:hypothetical protein
LFTLELVGIKKIVLPQEAVDLKIPTEFLYSVKFTVHGNETTYLPI